MNVGKKAGGNNVCVERITKRKAVNIVRVDHGGHTVRVEGKRSPRVITIILSLSILK